MAIFTFPKCLMGIQMNGRQGHVWTGDGTLWEPGERLCATALVPHARRSSAATLACGA